MNKMSCSKYRRWIDDASAGVLEDARRLELDEHIASCKACESFMSHTMQVVSVAGSQRVPDPGKEFWDTFYDNIVEKIELEDEGGVPSRGLSSGRLERRLSWDNIGNLLFPRTPAVQLAYGLCLVLLGIFLGRMVFTSNGPETETQFAETNTPPQIQSVSLDERTGRFFDRSKVLLLGIVNLDTDDQAGSYNLNRTRLVANELVKESDTLRTELEASDEQRLLKLMEDLEVILLQIANLEESADVPAIEMVKDGVDQRGVLLKINVTEMRNEFMRDGL